MSGAENSWSRSDYILEILSLSQESAQQMTRGFLTVLTFLKTYFCWGASMYGSALQLSDPNSLTNWSWLKSDLCPEPGMPTHHEHNPVSQPIWTINHECPHSRPRSSSAMGIFTDSAPNSSPRPHSPKRCCQNQGAEAYHKKHRAEPRETQPASLGLKFLFTTESNMCSNSELTHTILPNSRHNQLVSGYLRRIHCSVSVVRERRCRISIFIKCAENPLHRSTLPMPISWQEEEESMLKVLLANTTTHVGATGKLLHRIPSGEESHLNKLWMCCTLQETHSSLWAVLLKSHFHRSLILHEQELGLTSKLDISGLFPIHKGKKIWRWHSQFDVLLP